MQKIVFTFSGICFA